MAQTRLKQLREEAVLTVHELGEASGVSDDTISKIENGQRVARPSTLRKLADALDVSPQELRRPAKVEEPVPLAKAPREAGHSVAQRLENLQRYEAHISKIAEKYRTEAEPLLAAVGDADKPTEKDLDSLITLLAQTGWTFDGGYEYLKHDDAVVQAEWGTATERLALAKVKSALNAILDINEAIDAALDPHLDLGEEESRVVTNIQEFRQRRAG
jgi:transcriptional regulator with XRE-family HTH domain